MSTTASEEIAVRPYKLRNRGMKPLIGIATNPFCSEYADINLSDINNDRLNYYWLLARLTEKISISIWSAGGVPVMLSATDDKDGLEILSKTLDGFVFAGGEDISPSFYGESNKGSIAPNTQRDIFELGLLSNAIRNEKPILGICRGNQMINVALGGTLYQHIPDIKQEWSLHKRPDIINSCIHSVEILKPELFPINKGTKMNVNSMHHQAVEKMAPGLEVIAVTSDGLIEGVTLPGYKYLVGVQWHPECLSASDPIQEDMFISLVNASEKRN